ncbi:recombination protein RecR [Pseudoxanthomonas sp. SORGH_AS 997]|nr:recombination protein RecR [Pseudoxanthomonas sp. SORGH_AS_0997]
MTSSLLEQLIDALKVLPGVGSKSAQRMAYQLLERDRAGGRRLSSALAEAMEHIGHCQQCRDFTEGPLCAICASPSRDRHQLCVVESPADRLAIEQATGYRGLYFILQGRLSPLDGIGPRELGLEQLSQRLAQGEVAELIIATNRVPPSKARPPRTIWRSWRARRTSSPCAWRTACRWAESWSTSIAARSRTRSVRAAR